MDQSITGSRGSRVADSGIRTSDSTGKKRRTDEGNLNISTTLHTSESMKDDDDSLSLTFVLKDQDGAERKRKDMGAAG